MRLLLDQARTYAMMARVTDSAHYKRQAILCLTKIHMMIMRNKINKGE